MEPRTAIILGLLFGIVSAEYPYPSGKYPPPAQPAPDPAPAPGSGPGSAPSGPSGPGPSGPGPTGPVGPGPFGPGPSGPGPFPLGPSGPGPWGPFPWGPGPFPPFPFPPPFGPPPPFGHPGSICAALERFRIRALRAMRPLLAGGVGAALLWVVKSLIIPNISVVATAFRRRVGIDEDSPLERMATEVSRAITNGSCAEKIACTLGQSVAKSYPSVRHFARVVDPKSTGFLENFTEAFQRSVSHNAVDCEALHCP